MAKTKLKAARRWKRLKPGTHAKPKVLLREGDWLDVMDGDGVWNVARVLSVPTPDEVEITYDGWPEAHDEVVYVDSDRVAPYHTFTSAVKCWVKYLNWPLWPSVISIRTPGTPEGIRNLAVEHRLFVDFLDSPNFDERDRCWQKRRQVRTFEDNYDKKRTGSTGEHFERALRWILQSDALSKMPKFALGTLPAEYKLNPTESVQEVRKRMGDALWFQSFTLNRMRHQQCHVYEAIGGEEDVASDNSAPQSVANNDSDQSCESDAVVEVEVPFEQVVIESSGDSEGEGNLVNNRPKRRRLNLESRDAEASPEEEMNDCQVLPADSTNDNDNVAHQQICVIQPDKEGPQSVDTTDMVKNRKRKTTFSVPRKFVKWSNHQVQVPECCTTSMIRPAPPPRLRVSASDFRARAALASPSTQVFSSSRDFSMGSWFKRKLMADFMNGEA